MVPVLVKRSLTVGLVFLGFFFYFGHNYWVAHWFNKQALHLWIMSFFVAFAMARRFGIVVFFPILLTLFNGIYFAFWIPGRYTTFITPLMSEIQFGITSSLFIFGMYLAFFYQLNPRLKGYFYDAFAYLCTLDSLYVLCGYFYGLKQSIHESLLDNGLGFVIGNPGMNGCFIALTYPFLLRSLYKIFRRNEALHFIGFCVQYLLPLVAVYLVRASVPVGVMSVVLFCWSLKRYRLIQSKWPVWWEWATLFGFCVTVLGIGAYLAGFTLFIDPNGRYDVWSLAWKHMSKVIWSGTGVGTTMTLLPQLQAMQTPGFSVEGFFFLHNDWLQSLLELGVIPFASYLILAMSTIVKSWRSSTLFPALMGMMCFAFFDFPLHNPCLTFLFGFFIWDALTLMND